MEASTDQWKFYLFIITIYLAIYSVICTKTAGTQNVLSTQRSTIGSDVMNTLDYYNEENDPMVMFMQGSSYCKEKSTCSEQIYQTFPDKSCHCDELCGLLDDCCGNYVAETGSILKKEQFECVQLHEIIKNKDYGLHMVTKCSDKWEHNSTEHLCENVLNSEDIFLNLPVSYNNIMYKNMYCAQCNFIYSFEYWKAEIKCLNETGVRSLPEMTDCNLFYIRPKPEIGYRTCQLKPFVTDTCSDDNVENVEEINENCTEGVYSITYDSSGKAYRNSNCAECNGLKKNLFCELIEPQTPSNSTPTKIPKEAYSFRLLVDFNAGTVSENEDVSVLQICKDNEKYDSFSEICRQIYCAPPTLAVKGSCVLNSSYADNETIWYPGNCSLVKLNSSEYMLLNNSHLFLIGSNKTISEEEFHMNGSDIYVCFQTIVNCLNDCKASETLFQFDMLESYITSIGLIVSIVSLAITFTVYVTFSQLLNVPGKILLCLIISLFFAQLLFLLSDEFGNIPSLCTSSAILTHYFFLAAFCWMNVIALDLWMTFSNKFMSGGSRRNKSRFMKYNIYAWLTPFVIICSAIAVDFSPFDNDYTTLKPRYGKGVCWISPKNGLILFFVGPLALFKLFDVVSFVFTAIHIARAKRQGALARQKTRSRSCSCVINFKLSLIMGLTWVFAFVAKLTNETSMWYMFIIFNSLQGLFIAICFLCTKKVGRLLYDKYEQLSSKSTSGTQLSSIS